MSGISYFAETAQASSDIFTALGINWQLLILQIVAFLILVALLGKFVYPWLMKSVDERQQQIEATSKAAAAAQKAAAESQDGAEALLSRARDEAAEIVSTAKLEATSIIAAGTDKAQATAEKIVADARGELSKEVERAKKELHNETLELIALTTEKVVRKTHTSKADTELIMSLLKESK